MSYLNNNNYSTVLELALKEFNGTDLSTLDSQSLNMKDIIMTGDTSGDLMKCTDQFVKTIFQTVIKLWFTDTKYRSQYADPYLVESEEYGSIKQSITVEVGETRDSSAWKVWTNGETISDEDSIFLPIVHTKLFGKSVSYELPIAITENQFNNMLDKNDINSLISYIMMAVDNALVQRMETSNAMNRNNFIAEKLAYSAKEDSTGIHKINLVQEYCDMFGITEMEATAFEEDADALRWANKRLEFYSRRLQGMSKSYNVSGFNKFIPSDRFVCEINGDFVNICDSVAYTNAYNPEFTKYDNYRVVPYWQFENPGINPLTKLPYSMGIDIKTASDEGETTVTNGAVVAFMCDKYAIRHVIREEVVVAHRFDRRRITQYYYQHVDSYENDLDYPALVFTIEDVTVTA